MRLWPSLTVLLLLLAALPLAACAPAPLATPVAQVGEVLPVEAQRVIDRATATAGALATQVAGTTATAAVAVATSTAAARATWDSLAVAQTQAAMGATATGQAAAGTQVAAIQTQAAQQTAAAAVSTAAAAQTEAARTAATFEQQTTARANAAAFWQTLGVVIVAVVVVLGVVVCVLLCAWAVTRIRIEEMRQKATVARDAFRILPGYWAEYQDGDGYRVYALPSPTEPEAPVSASGAVVENVAPTPSRVHAWRSTFRRFAWAGDRFGFSMRKLVAEGVVTEPAWRKLTKIFREAGVLAGRNDGTQWAGGWDYRRFADEFGQFRLSLPHPDEEPPAVTAPGAVHTTTVIPHTTRATRELVES